MAATVFVAFNAMPLLMELVSRKDGLCYKHGAPNGALTPSKHQISLATAKGLAFRAI
jgi:hypothetical protein